MTEGRACTSVSIIDDHPIFAEAVAVALKLSGDLLAVSVSVTAETGFTAISNLKPDLAIIDYRLGGTSSGVDLCEQIRAADLRVNGTPIPILLLTGYPTPALYRSTTQIGSAAVLSKSSSMTDVISEIRRCTREGPTALQPIDDPFGLSPAESEVLEYLSAGRNADQIARTLCLSIHAVRARIRGLLRKLDAGSQLEAVSRAMSHGLVAPP